MARISPKLWLGILIILALGVAGAIYFARPHPTGRPVVAIATLMTHPSLDALEKGLRDELADEGYVEGKNIEYVVRNANGQIPLTATIANELASRNPSVIVPITTPMAQAVLKAWKGPIVFSSVTDPISAKVVPTLAGQPNITGASDAWPYEAQIKLIRELTPKARRIGVLFNPGESASQFGIQQIRKFAAQEGLILVEAPVSSTNDMYPAARGLVGRVDALYLSSDNTVISGMAGALKVALENKLPYYVGDSGTVEKGGLAAVSVGYYQHGRHTGQLIARTLRGERNIPVVVESGTEVFVNTKAAELMGVVIPENVLKRAAHVYIEIRSQ